jgi:osmotically-inducible protein OsmY
VQQAGEDARAATAQAGDRLEDGWLTTKIQAQYFADDDIKARDIDVTTRDGVVTLRGTVGSEAARRQAVEIARNTDGVLDVTDSLAIGAPAGAAPQSRTPSGAVATTGDAIERTTRQAGARLDAARVTAVIQAKYFLDTAVKGRHIDVDTRDGVVTLRGEVASEAERAQALQLARNTEGVQRVEDHLTVNTALDAGPG